MLEMLIPALALVVPAVGAVYFFTSFKTYAPMTQKEAKALWEIHRHEEQCGSERWRQITCKNAIVGFECACGYRHVQKRPLA